MMLKMPSNSSYHHLHHPDPLSDPFSVSSLVDEVHQKADSSNSLGFMDLLGFQDSYYSSVFDNTTTYQLPPPPESLPESLPVEMEVAATSADEVNKGGFDCTNDYKKEVIKMITTVDEESSVVLNGQPTSPNSSSITSPAHNNSLNNECTKDKKAMGGDEAKPKKKKKEKAPRFAFLTRTEIDHLDDGYRWRKYGQKAVKNSRFPRSYYRCTSATCNVKKRVERCMNDPSYVITTYEGQHNHPISPNPSPLIPSFNHLINTATTTPPAVLKLDQGGLLQDMLHCHH